MCDLLRSRTALVYVAAAGCVAMASAPASATFSDPFVRVTASNGSGTGTFLVPLGDVTIDGGTGVATYILPPGPVSIMDGPNVVATLTSMIAIARPLSGAGRNQISLAFNLTAGSSDTTFIVDSTLFTIDPIIEERANMTAGASITDLNGNGALLTGANGSGQAYRAAYNGVAPGGTQFASVINNLAAVAGGSNAVSMSVPGGGLFTPVGDVIDMSTRWHFVMSAGDSVGVTSVYNIIPGPGAISLLAIGGLMAGRRRRN